MGALFDSFLHFSVLFYIYVCDVAPKQPISWPIFLQNGTLAVLLTPLINSNPPEGGTFPLFSPGNESLERRMNEKEGEALKQPTLPNHV